VRVYETYPGEDQARSPNSSKEKKVKKVNPANIQWVLKMKLKQRKEE
jgi:hypothetical protein